MLFTLKEIQEYQLNAVDGEFGKIKAFLVDDFEWIVRYLVVEVGSRNVLLSVLAVGDPDRDHQVLPVNVTKEKIMNSPNFNVNQRLTRETERQFSDYFEWPYYWEPDDVPNTLPGDLTAVPLIDMELDREQQEGEQELIPQTGTTGSEAAQSNDHLRSTQALFGSTIHTTNDDRSAGKLSDIVAQSEDWNVLYLVVDTGGLLTGKKVLVSPNWVQRIDEAGSRIDVNLKQETIQASPEFHSALDLDSDYQSRLSDYYNQ